MVQSGGTLTETYNGIGKFLSTIRGYDPLKIKYIPIVTHSVFPKEENVATFFDPANNIHKLITTDTRPLKVKSMKTSFADKVEVISISGPIHDIFINNQATQFIAPYSIN